MSAPTPYYLIISYETPQAGDVTSVLLTKDNYSHYFPSPDLPLFLPLSIFASSLNICKHSAKWDSESIDIVLLISNNSAHISTFQQSWALNTALATLTAWASGTLASTARAPALAPARRAGTCSAAALSTTRWTRYF